jgi:hypothetical protein
VPVSAANFENGIFNIGSTVPAGAEMSTRRRLGAGSPVVSLYQAAMAHMFGAMEPDRSSESRDADAQRAPFGLMTALWPASIQVADACPAT